MANYKALQCKVALNSSSEMKVIFFFHVTTKLFYAFASLKEVITAKTKLVGKKRRSHCLDPACLKLKFGGLW